jgi:hypothetical protein
MEFRTLVASLGIETGATIEERLCPDQCIGRLRELELAGAITARDAAENRPAGAGVLLVLESPHIEEFKAEPAPARGKTGLHIARYLRQVVGSTACDDFPVTLVNAVRHQCSLGYSPTDFRDRVFSAVWENGGRGDFVDRLRLLYRPGDLVVCCCTKGSSRTSAMQLRQLVYAAIVEVLPQAQVSRRTHPSSWFSRRNRLYVWAEAPNATLRNTDPAGETSRRECAA